MIQTIHSAIIKLKFPLLLLIAVLSVFYIYIFIKNSHALLFRFPIPGIHGMLGENLPLHFIVRYILTIICDGYMLIFLAVPILYFQNRFKNSAFFKRYIKFWWIGGVIFSSILSILIGYFMNEDGMPIFIFTMVSFWSLTLTPAYYQYNKAHKPHKLDE